VTEQVEVVKEIGVAPHRMFLGSDGLWRFEDTTRYYDAQDSADGTPLQSDAASHRRPSQKIDS
jgi:hypothetical protein